jgi:hypothetical protein
VMNRGDRREEIFEDDQDRRLFLETLEEGCEKAVKGSPIRARVNWQKNYRSQFFTYRAATLLPRESALQRTTRTCHFVC